MSFLLQPIRPFEFTSPVYDYLISQWLSIKPISSYIFSHSDLRKSLTRRVINERIIETPFIFRSLPPPPAKILDVGSCESPISLMLASLGYSVTALDTRPYHFDHPNLEVAVSDVRTFNPNRKFDSIMCISTLEHIGVAVYGNQGAVDADLQAVRQMQQLLKPKGILLLTAPVAPAPMTFPHQRIYSPPQLKKLLSSFSGVSIRYGIRDKNHWTIADKLPSGGRYSESTPSAVALVLATK